MTLKQVTVNALIVLSTLAGAFLLWEFRDAIFLFIFSLAIAAAARPYVEALTRHGFSRALAILLVYVLFITFLGLVFWLVGGSLVKELQDLSDSVAYTYDKIWTNWPHGSQVQKLIAQQLPDPALLYKSFSPEQRNSLLGNFLGFTLTTASLLAEVFTLLVLSIYWSIDQVHFERLWLSLLPVELRAHSRNIWRGIEMDFGIYVRSQLMQSIAAGFLLGLGLWMMGLKYPVLLAVFSAVAWLIPWLGGVLAVLPIALTGLSQGTGLAIFAPTYAIGVLFLLKFLIEPRFLRRQQFSSLLSILLIIALIEPYGLLGLIVAPPLAAAIELIFRYSLLQRGVPVPLESEEQIAELRERILAIRETIAASEEPPQPQTLNMLTRLEKLIDRADQLSDRQMQRVKVYSQQR